MQSLLTETKRKRFSIEPSPSRSPAKRHQARPNSPTLVVYPVKQRWAWRGVLVSQGRTVCELCGLGDEAVTFNPLMVLRDNADHRTAEIMHANGAGSAEIGRALRRHPQTIGNWLHRDVSTTETEPKENP